MRLYFNIEGNFNTENKIPYFDTINFIYNNQEYCLDIVGDVDFDFNSNEYSGRVKFDYVHDLETNEDISDIIMSGNAKITSLNGTICDSETDEEFDLEYTDYQLHFECDGNSVEYNK